MVAATRAPAVAAAAMARPAELGLVLSRKALHGLMRSLAKRGSALEELELLVEVGGGLGVGCLGVLVMFREGWGVRKRCACIGAARAEAVAGAAAR